MLGWFRFLRTVSLVVALGVITLAPPVAAETPTVASGALSPDRVAALARELSSLEAWVQKHGGRLGASFVSVESGTVLAATGQDQALNPASNAKLLTAGAALADLGPSYRFHTGIYGRIASDGTAEKLVIRGDGDPALTSLQLAGLVSTLVGKGLRRVGRIEVDQSRFDANYVPPAFAQQPNEWAAFRAPVSAVAVDENSITIHVQPTESGAAARIWVDPPGAAELSGTVSTVGRGKGQAVRLKVRPASGRVKVTVGGHIAEGLPMMLLRRRVDDPHRLPGFVLAELLRRRGVGVTGGVAEGGADALPALALHASEPVAVLVRALGKQSDNFVAEMLLKALGARASGGPGSSAAGAQAVLDWMSHIGVSSPGTVVKNGSGLFDANRVSARTLASVLSQSYQSPALRTDYLGQLSIGGVDGTLRSRFKSHAATRIVRAKTGTLARVIALSGLVLPPSGRSPIAFAVIVDGVSGRHAQTRKRIDRTVERAIDALWK